MTNKTKRITSINEWKTFQDESRKLLDKFITGEISDVYYKSQSLDSLFISTDIQELYLDLECYIPINTIYISSAVINLISIEKLNGVDSLLFYNCLIGELEISNSDIPNISFDNCTIGFLNIVSLQCKNFRLFDSQIDELNIKRAKFKRLKIVETAIELGNIDLCTFFKIIIKNCDLKRIHIIEALMPKVKVDHQTKLETTLNFLTYLKSKDIHKNINKYFNLGGRVCEQTKYHLQLKESSILVFDDTPSGVMAVFLGAFPQFLKNFGIDPSTMGIKLFYPSLNKAAIEISKNIDKKEFYELFHAYTLFLLKSHGRSIFLDDILQDKIKQENIDENELLKNLCIQFKMFDSRFSDIKTLWEIKSLILKSFEKNQLFLEEIEDLKLDVVKMEVIVTQQKNKLIQSGCLLESQLEYRDYSVLRKIN
ncbi:MAG: hypothetical protein COB02_18205 [Candidatus Cloacimonadota bacterium]|nr:MAG: hypothetical protein COB02_18205 [Candidatus Cloacimonadota bacterium]